MSVNLTEIKLTRFSHGSGCGCKIEPAVLEKILNNENPGSKFSSLAGGYETKDDAAVWDLGENYLLSTTDFFTPIVDDPFEFGMIAAANALSDIYAMGGKPAFALAILGFPVNELPVEIAKEIVSGAKHICDKAGIPLAGGHSIDIPEPVFGLAVNGFVEKKYLKKNNSGKPGDVLFLTKPLGIGIMASAMKRDKIRPEEVTSLIKLLCRLNDVGEKVAKISGVNAMTDVTGFGFLGHLAEMCEGSNVSAEIDYKKILLIDGVQKYMEQFIFPDNTYRNWNSYEKKVSGINGPAFISLSDPQTSGGLLIAAREESVTEITELFIQHNLQQHIEPVGKLISKKDKLITLLNA
jgi:selenide,water dikinase